MTHRRTRFVHVALAVCLAVPALEAAEAPLDTDRPGVGDSALVVPRGSIQLETGLTRSTDESGAPDVDVTSLLGTLVRWGLTDRLELRTGFDGLIDVDVDGLGGDDGAGDTSLGVKLALRDGSDGGPAAGLVLATSLPTGEDGFGAEEAQPALSLVVSHGVSERAGLAYYAALRGVSTTDPGGDDHLLGEAASSVSLGASLSERVAGFVELAASWPLAAGGAPTTLADAGLTFRVRERLQLDISAGVGLSDAAEGSFVSVGLAYRRDRD